MTREVMFKLLRRYCCVCNGGNGSRTGCFDKSEGLPGMHVIGCCFSRLTIA